MLAALMLSACATLRTDIVKEPSRALPPATDTPTAKYINAELGSHADASGFRLLSLSTNALMSRIALADHAQHSIDLQYYIYEDDATGRLISQRLLAAADRGVRVRLLLDHNKIDDAMYVLEALDAHKNIEVRLFNPFLTQRPTLVSKVAQLIVDGSRLNRRMHNKMFIVDNIVAVIGGRNIGDEYFDASSDTRFRDLDLVAIGRVVPEASKSFDEYWNSDAAYPLTAFRTHHGTRRDTAKLRAKSAEDVRKFAESDYAQAVLAELPNGPTADRWGDWFWGPAKLVADEPEKAEPQPSASSLQVAKEVKKLMDSAQSELLLISAYFIPGETGIAYLGTLTKRGVGVKVLTNSLASTDEPLAQAAYAKQRLPLLEHGVDLYELRPAAVEKPHHHGSGSNVALHAKALVVDGRSVFIGSMNMDPRSRLINTEVGLIVENEPLAAAVKKFFATATMPGNAYHVVLEDGRLAWRSGENGGDANTRREPEATTQRRIHVALMKLLPIDNLL
jgi:putative cardiolipin synthase